MWYCDLVSFVHVLKQLDCFNRIFNIHHRLPVSGKGHHLQKPAGSSMETSLSTSSPQVTEMVKYTENLNSFHIWVIICHIAVRIHSWINQVYSFSLVKRNLSQFGTWENWGLICWKWIVIPILSTKIKKRWMYQKLDSYKNKEYMPFNIDYFAFDFPPATILNCLTSHRETLASTVIYLNKRMSSFVLFSSIRMVLDCFHLLISYFEKFSTWVPRLP